MLHDYKFYGVVNFMVFLCWFQNHPITETQINIGFRLAV